MLNLPAETWLRFAIWMVIGLVLYFFYSLRHSRLAPGAGGGPGTDEEPGRAVPPLGGAAPLAGGSAPRGGGTMPPAGGPLPPGGSTAPPGPADERR
jgi:hypothetical protein